MQVPAQSHEQAFPSFVCRAADSLCLVVFYSYLLQVWWVKDCSLAFYLIFFNKLNLNPETFGSCLQSTAVPAISTSSFCYLRRPCSPAFPLSLLVERHFCSTISAIAHLCVSDPYCSILFPCVRVFIWVLFITGNIWLKQYLLKLVALLLPHVFVLGYKRVNQHGLGLSCHFSSCLWLYWPLGVAQISEPAAEPELNRTPVYVQRKWELACVYTAH